MSQYLCRKHRALNASRVILLHLVECLAESIMQKNSQRGQTDECREVCRSAEQSTKKTEANFIASDLENIYPRNICVYAKCVKCVSCVQTCNVCVKGSSVILFHSYWGRVSHWTCEPLLCLANDLQGSPCLYPLMLMLQACTSIPSFLHEF